MSQGLGVDSNLNENCIPETDIFDQWSEGTDDALTESFKVFDFTVPLPDKTSNTLQVFYNNCNGLEINQLIADVLQ